MLELCTVVKINCRCQRILEQADRRKNVYDEMLSGPEALRILSRLNNVRTSATLMVKGGDRGVSVGRGRCSGDMFIVKFAVKVI